MATNVKSPDNSQHNSGFLRLPDSLIEASKVRRENVDHRAMHKVGASIEAKRACNEAIVFAYGVSGTGASATLNHLFNYEIIPTSDSKSQTTTVSEYVSIMKSDEWEAENLRICFINPPGYGDTKGESHDVMNLAAIEEFISKQRHLGNKFYKCYPNIVLITVNANDYRIRGEQSHFNKMLNALKHLQMVDTNNPNLVVALTHAMSIPMGCFAKKIQEQTECIQEIIKEKFGIEGSIVYIENSAESYCLQKLGDWTLLTDGTRQPLNLFQAMIALMAQTGDEVGVEAIRLFFPGGRECTPKQGMVVHIGPANEAKIHHWARVINHRKIRIIDNACTIVIKDYLRKEPSIPKEDLLPLMSELIRAKVTQPKDIRGINIAEVQKQVWPYMLTPLDKKVLIEVFDVHASQYIQFLEEIGHGCYTNEIKPNATELMFNFINEQTFAIINGVYLPDCMEIDFAESTTVYCYCPTLTLIKDSVTSVSQQRTESGCVSNEKNAYTFVFMVTHNILSLKMPSLEKLRKYLNPELKKSFEDLPEDCIVEQTDKGTNCHPLYLEFLKRYGHCILTYWEGGGIVSGQITVDISHLEIIKTEAIIKNYLKMYFTSSNLTKETYEEDLVNYVVKALHAANLSYKGGSPPLVKDNILGGLDSNKIEGWKRSLLDNPTPLDNIQRSKLHFTICEIVKELGHEKCIKLKQVLDLIAPEYDIDERLIEMEAEYYLNDKTFFGVKQTIEPPVTPEHRPRRSTFHNEDEYLRDYCNITMDDIQEVEESTRVYAARRAKSNTRYGFPYNARVWRKKQEDLDAEEIEITDLEEGDLVECVSKNQLRVYVPITKIFRDPGDFQYFQAEHDHGKIVIGELNYVLRGNRLKKVSAKKLKIRDRLVWAEPRGTKIKTTHIKQIRLVSKRGNIQINVNDDDFVYIIVNGIVCGGQGSGCFPGNASVELRGGERVRMDALKIGDYVLSIHPTTGKPVYSRVYLWAHRDPHITATFLHITHPHGHLHISAHHLILSGDQRRPVPADQLRVGDSIHFISPCLSKQEKKGEREGEGEERGDSHTLISVPVLHIQTCTQVGYYAPFTNNGLIVVDGIAASVYTNLSTHSQSDSSSWLWSGVWHSVTSGLVQQFGMQRVGQCVLTPVRVGCKLGMGSALSQQMDTNTHIHKYCQWLLNSM